jgi:hypothetical protein
LLETEQNLKEKFLKISINWKELVFEMLYFWVGIKNKDLTKNDPVGMLNKQKKVTYVFNIFLPICKWNKFK